MEFSLTLSNWLFSFTFFYLQFAVWLTSLDFCMCVFVFQKSMLFYCHGELSLNCALLAEGNFQFEVEISYGPFTQRHIGSMNAVFVPDANETDYY